MRPDLSSARSSGALPMRLIASTRRKAGCRKALEMNPPDRRAAELLKDLGNP